MEKVVKAFGVRVLTAGGFGNPFGNERSGCIGTKIIAINRPEQVVLTILAEPQDEISPIAVHREETHEYTSSLKFSFSVPIKWEKGEGKTWTPLLPDWRKEENFANVIVPDRNLHFTDTQVSLVARESNLYVMIQKVYQGWIREQGEKVIFIPSAPEFARPGLDYREQWKARGRTLAVIGSIASQVSKALGSSLPMPKAAKWENVSTPNPNGEILAKVAHFNPITDSGLAIGRNGTEYQLLGKYLAGFEGPVQIPGHGTLVLLKTAPKKPGYNRILAISCRPAS